MPVDRTEMISVLASQRRKRVSRKSRAKCSRVGLSVQKGAKFGRFQGTYISWSGRRLVTAM
jgi:hypothetical protein